MAPGYEDVIRIQHKLTSVYKLKCDILSYHTPDIYWETTNGQSVSFGEFLEIDGRFRKEAELEKVNCTAILRAGG